MLSSSKPISNQVVLSPSMCCAIIPQYNFYKPRRAMIHLLPVCHHQPKWVDPSKRGCLLVRSTDFARIFIRYMTYKAQVLVSALQQTQFTGFDEISLWRSANLLNYYIRDGLRIDTLF
ncbi:hypothetical protein GJ496_005599 [Pomphorhynchus laevis]|nr:hypothetical protein GJ496_005599 [Pomphorhynchus laevis]